MVFGWTMSWSALARHNLYPKIRRALFRTHCASEHFELAGTGIRGQQGAESRRMQDAESRHTQDAESRRTQGAEQTT